MSAVNILKNSFFQKSNLPEDEDVVVQTPKSIGLKVDIVGKVSG